MGTIAYNPGDGIVLVGERHHLPKSWSYYPDDKEVNSFLASGVLVRVEPPSGEVQGGAYAAVKAYRDDKANQDNTKKPEPPKEVAREKENPKPRNTKRGSQKVRDTTPEETTSTTDQEA